MLKYNFITNAGHQLLVFCVFGGAVLGGGSRKATAYQSPRRAPSASYGASRGYDDRAARGRGSYTPVNRLP